jgi:membrane protease YdiL (CAAX protease family)
VGLRIPLGTALGEEILFRGALLGLLLQRHAVGKAVAVSSCVFGLWHVVPTLQSLHAGVDLLPGGGAVRVALIVAGAVTVTTAAGCVFAWLRLRGSSVVAPFLAHASINSLAALAGRVAGP